MGIEESFLTNYENKLERLRGMLKSDGLKISRMKTEFLELGFGNTVGNNRSKGEVRLGIQILDKVDKFKWFGCARNRGIAENVIRDNRVRLEEVEGSDGILV